MGLAVRLLGSRGAPGAGARPVVIVCLPWPGWWTGLVDRAERRPALPGSLTVRGPRRLHGCGSPTPWGP